MRSVYLDINFLELEEVTLPKDKSHHILNVLRMKKSEKLLLLNGRGVSSLTEIIETSKTSVKLKIVERYENNRSHSIDIVLGLVKKDALDLCIKQAVELGIRKLYLVEAEYSDARWPKMERIESLITSAMEQSNNSFKLEVEVVMNFKELPFANYSNIQCFHPESTQNKSQSLDTNNILLLIGPEGGFSENELSILRQLDTVNFETLPTPILRAPTALSAAMGYCLAKFS